MIPFSTSTKNIILFFIVTKIITVQSCQVENEYQGGSDLSIVEDIAGPEECSQLCAANTECELWTYFTANYQEYFDELPK